MFMKAKMNQNDTPRTDAALKDVLQTGQHPKVKAEFARELERAYIKSVSENVILEQALDELAQWNDRPKNNPDSLNWDDFSHFDSPHAAIVARKALNEVRRKSL